MTDFLKTTHRTVNWLKRAFDADELTLKPPYQRNPVWLHPQKAYLIDTILRGYPIPELYMQDTVDAVGGEHHYVVDGQQRIRACLEFIEDDFELDEEMSPEYGAARFEELPDAARQQIYGYQFVVRLMPDIDEVELRNIFKRLNKNVVALNRQELRHSTYWGLFITCMERLAADEFWVESGIFSANDFRRMLDVEYVSELAIGYIHGLQNKKGSLDKWYATYEEEFPQQDEVEDAFRAVTGELRQVLPEMRRTRWRNKSDSYSLFLTFAKHVESLPLARESREAAHESLMDFDEKVNTYLTQVRAGLRPRTTRRVSAYGGAVQRAATDLGNRRIREGQLESLLADVW